MTRARRIRTTLTYLFLALGTLLTGLYRSLRIRTDQQLKSLLRDFCFYDHVHVIVACIQ